MEHVVRTSLKSWSPESPSNVGYAQAFARGPKGGYDRSVERVSEDGATVGNLGECPGRAQSLSREVGIVFASGTTGAFDLPKPHQIRSFPTARMAGVR